MQGLPYAVINIPTRQKQTTFCLFFNIEDQLDQLDQFGQLHQFSSPSIPQLKKI